MSAVISCHKDPRAFVLLSVSVESKFSGAVTTVVTLKNLISTRKKIVYRSLREIRAYKPVNE